MPRWLRPTLISAVVLAVVATLVVGLRAQAPARAAADGNPGGRDVIVHLFEWPWNSVATECTTVLGPKGFGAVQVSPPQEHVELASKGYPWWQDYQPVSYQLTTRRGDRAAFASMVATCHAAGVKIYVDAVINHMTGGGSAGNGPGSAGSTYTQYTYPAVPYGTGDFHHCGRNGNDDIQNWTDRFEVQNCELVDLADLKTESSYVRGEITGYLNNLIGLGVDGFRVDAAKHMPVADLQAMYGSLNNTASGRPYIYQEVIEGGNGEISPTEYTGIGDVTDFRYGDVVGNAFGNGGLANLQNLPSQMLLANADAQVFIDNHDTQRNGRAKLNYKSGTNYALAEAFMLAYPFGTVSVMSSFSFSGADQGPPATSNGTTTAVSCGNGWVCEHRVRTTANLVGFHNTVNGTAITQWWSNGNNQIAFGRGSAGYVVFNREGSSLSRTFQTELAAGTYCDVANGDVSGSTCGGAAYTINSSGQFTATVPANTLLALHINARTSGGGTPSPTPTTSCTTATASVRENATTIFGENIFIVGNTASLGNWDPNSAVALSSASYPVWTGSVQLPLNTTVQYKYIKKNGSQVIWESDPNRSVSVGGACTLTLNDTWR
jgi:alpha-amylase